eukprot:TRINITY_DN58773_c0_g1_i1.p1 TRINITY_DN58773_c0_g1~~TRINITY_DN58773_c0_g1_i1.p1  ORF type:complete len:333 (-),score=-34.11 TRINITY_DN58773_c0_g1_i1:33-1031(-)
MKRETIRSKNLQIFKRYILQSSTQYIVFAKFELYHLKKDRRVQLKRCEIPLNYIVCTFYFLNLNFSLHFEKLRSHFRSGQKFMCLFSKGANFSNSNTLKKLPKGYCKHYSISQPLFMRFLHYFGIQQHLFHRQSYLSIIGKKHDFKFVKQLITQEIISIATPEIILSNKMYSIFLHFKYKFTLLSFIFFETHHAYVQKVHNQLTRYPQFLSTTQQFQLYFHRGPHKPSFVQLLINTGQVFYGSVEYQTKISKQQYGSQFKRYSLLFLVLPQMKINQYYKSTKSSKVLAQLGFNTLRAQKSTNYRFLNLFQIDKLLMGASKKPFNIYRQIFVI